MVCNTSKEGKRSRKSLQGIGIIIIIIIIIIKCIEGTWTYGR